MTSHKNSTKIALKLYFIKEKRLLVVFLVMLLSVSLLSQENIIAPDSLIIRQDSVIKDTVLLKKISPEAIEKQVTYKADGYKKNDLVNKKSTLVKNAEVNYDNIKITADSIEFNMETSQVFATGIKDTAGSVTGKPVLQVGSDTYNADTLTYNFKSGKAVVKVIATQQEDGLLRSRVAKMLEDGSTNIYRSTYSTCEADTPHFYINLPKAKVYPGKKIISGPGNLVMAGVPLPLFLPFGYFPIQTKHAASGIIIPKPHYEEGRGYALTDGGYYFALNNYFDLTLQGNIFTNGSWLTTIASNYNKRYKYSGNFSFSYANNISGHKGLQDYRKSANYKIGWNYSQNAKARPGSRFSASVNMSSSGFDRNNSYNLNEHITTQRQSSISYSKSWEGTPFNFSASMNHSQNIRGKHPTVNLNLPKMDFSMSRIYPLKSRRQSGPGKWYQELSFSYSAKVDNQISTYDSLLFTNKVWNNMKSGFSHQIPMSFQLRPFRNFSISPSLSYNGVLYTQKINKAWNINYKDPETNQIKPIVVKDTTRGYFYGHSINPSISAGYSPQIFGLFQFINPDSRIQAIRHVMKPSVSFSYIPFLKGLSTSMYRQVQSDTTGRMEEYSIFEGGLFGTPSLSRKSGNVSFSLTNILEAKVFERDDTTGKPKNMKLIDNFGITTSYNVFADSLNWSPVNMVMRTSLLHNINISAGGNFSFYALDSKGRQTGRFYYNETKKPLRLTNVMMSLDFSLNELLKRDESKRKPAMTPSAGGRGELSDTPGQETDRPGESHVTAIFDEYGYMKFDVPWTMNVAYSINYTKLYNSSQLTQTLMVNGNLSLTKKMNITFNSGYDFKRKEITMTQIAVTRDLHCWDMSFNWIPNGTMKMWEFSIRVKAPILSDLKYERRKDYHDNY